jgi:hypothetical protein
MRRDAFLANDSGGLSIVAGDAVDAVIEDGRQSDARFAAGDKAILLELYGDDAMPVRVVVDEPLQPEEEAEWLARVSRPVETTDGRLLVMGGFDPDILRWWRDETGGDADGRGVIVVRVPAGRWRVDLYAHAGSMNGRQVIEAEFGPIGTGFRADHPGRPFPLWLARTLDWSGEEDPGHEAAWGDARASVASGALSIDTDGGAAIGFLIHVTPDSGGPCDEVPDGAWFALDTNARRPARFPLGLATAVADPAVEEFLDRLLDREAPEPPRPLATRYVDLIGAWSGESPVALEGAETVELAPRDAYLLYWAAGMTGDASPPRFEIQVSGAHGWTPPVPTPDVAVRDLGDGVTGIGPVANQAGWGLWWAARAAARSLGDLPGGAVMALATAPFVDDAAGDDPPAGDPGVGRMLFSGGVWDGVWRIEQASPPVTAEALRAALAFVRDVAQAGRLTVRPGDEREAFDAAAEMFAPQEGDLAWGGNTVALAEPDERSLILLAGPVFRVRFADTWTMGRDDEDEDDD